MCFIQTCIVIFSQFFFKGQFTFIAALVFIPPNYEKNNNAEVKCFHLFAHFIKNELLLSTNFQYIAEVQSVIQLLPNHTSVGQTI